jgi:hypothetical protein
MAEQAPGPEVKQALSELQRYLSDQVAPMMVMDSVELLLQHPPQLVAQEIHGWVVHQAGGGEYPLSDYLFHAVKKVHLMSEFDLIEQELVDRFVQDLGQIILELCPVEDRETLRTNLGALGQTEVATSAKVELFHGQRPQANAATQAPAAGGVSVDVERSLKRFSVLINQLQRGAGSDTAESEGAVSQALTAAAVGARSGGEFEEHLQQLRRLGIDAKADQVFKTLGASIPGWTLPPEVAKAGEGVLPEPHQLEAMRRIIAMADPTEGAHRFSEMVKAAIELFNEGRIVPAMSMIDLAERIVAEKKVEEGTVKSIRGTAHRSLDEGRLRAYSEQADKHGPLRRVMSFFPGLTPRGLLDSLQDEPRRDRRKLFLALLEVHGEAARHAALERLQSLTDPQSDPQGYFRRNLVFLLRRIERPPDDPVDPEIQLVIPHTGFGTPLLLLKEAISALGQMPGAATEATLRERLNDYEAMLLAGDEGVYGDAGELRGLLDRLVAALCQLGTSTALDTAVEHCFKRKPVLGDTMARLEKLGGRDLSGHASVLEKLVTMLRGLLPMKVLGFVVQSKGESIEHLIAALVGTPAPEVRQLFEEIVERFPEQPFSRSASRAIVGFGGSSRPDPTPATSLSGDVELFGLPNLLQTLSDSKVTGQLALKDRSGDSVGTLTFGEGTMLECAAGHISGERAFYQLFEKPVPGTFAFTRQGGLQAAEGVEPIEVMPALLEAMRRHDEFGQARAMVPDDAALKPTGSNPTCPEETDLEILRQVWLHASKGVPPGKCEQELPLDSFEVRRLYAHWLEEGVLELQ